MTKLTAAALAAALLALSACGQTPAMYQTQENWAQAMRDTYPAGTQAADVEASVTAAGMSFEPVPNAYRILPSSVTGDGSGYWRRIVKVDATLGCDMRRTVYFRFDDGDQLIGSYPGNSSCV